MKLDSRFEAHSLTKAILPSVLKGLGYLSSDDSENARQMYGPQQFIRERGIIGLVLPRQTGKTTALIDLYALIKTAGMNVIITSKFIRMNDNIRARVIERYGVDPREDMIEYTRLPAILMDDRKVIDVVLCDEHDPGSQINNFPSRATNTLFVFFKT